jgi:hypothetical protein
MVNSAAILFRDSGSSISKNRIDPAPSIFDASTNSSGRAAVLSAALGTGADLSLARLPPPASPFVLIVPTFFADAKPEGCVLPELVAKSCQPSCFSLTRDLAALHIGSIETKGSGRAAEQFADASALEPSAQIPQGCVEQARNREEPGNLCWPAGITSIKALMSLAAAPIAQRATWRWKIRAANPWAR